MKGEKHRDIAGTVGKQALWGLLDVWFDTKPQDSCLTGGV